MALFCQMFANLQHNTSVKNVQVLRPGAVIRPPTS
jgi:hypothetical protein